VGGERAGEYPEEKVMTDKIKKAILKNRLAGGLAVIERGLWKPRAGKVHPLSRYR